jgi:hypothetical protein
MNAASFFYQAGVSVLIYMLLARWYVWPFLKRQERGAALTLLLLPSLLRQVGATHLAPTVVPDPVSPPLAWAIVSGDLACMVSALISIMLLRSHSRLAMPMVWACFAINVVQYLGIGGWTAVEQAYDHLGAHWYVGAYYVPLLGVLQVMVLMVLLKRDWPGDARRSGGAAAVA